MGYCLLHGLSDSTSHPLRCLRQDLFAGSFGGEVDEPRALVGIVAHDHRLSGVSFLVAASSSQDVVPSSPPSPPSLARYNSQK